ncbi:hypothetical protein FB45DRAFT_1037384 [Roridomyces roridus]|uniref:Uncharacterized protein n=1 Tax=Roridomyces roridus TaxID=1738132 RepID=A0AAD7FCA1_9AGAR|nr:hypothetical protein FB45DRAFT_1037384 [Roridomyces roridus]
MPDITCPERAPLEWLSHPIQRQDGASTGLKPVLTNRSIFSDLEFTHKTWANRSVPRRFLGLDEDSDEESDEESRSSTTEWEAPAEDDDAISWDSHITGVEPEQLAQASIARGDYPPDEAWLEGVENWVESTAGVAENDDLVSTQPIVDDSDELPRVASSLDLAKPDFLRLHRTTISPNCES